MSKRKRPADPDLTRELAFHVDSLVAEKVAAGMNATEARRQAMLEFGGSEQVTEELRDVHRLFFVDAAFRHLSYGLRMLRRSPAFSLTVVLTLMLGIGANTTVFSAIYDVILRPLPYPQPDALMVLHELRLKNKAPQQPVAPARLEDWNHLASAFSGITGYYTEDAADTSGQLARKMQIAYVAPRFLQVLGIGPKLGRDFSLADDHYHKDAPQSVLISDRLWKLRFASDPNIIGKPLIAGKSSAKNSAIVIGVMPASFALPSREVDEWYEVPPDAPYTTDRRNTWYTAIGRLKNGESERTGEANLNWVQRQLAKQYPATDTSLAVQVGSLKRTTLGTVDRSLWLLFAAVSVLLLLACTNVAALLLARGIDREAEISVRLSLGASRTTVITQLLVEALLLAAGGASLGLAVAATGAKVFRQLAKAYPGMESIRIDWHMFAYAAVCAIAVTIGSALAPALLVTRRAIFTSSHQGGRTAVSHRGAGQWALVAIQVTLAVALLAGAGTLLRSFDQFSRVQPGFETAHVLTFQVTGSYAETVNWGKLAQSVSRQLDALRSIPGVKAAAASLFLPGLPLQFPQEFSLTDAPVDPGKRITADNRYVSSGYFSTMQIPVLSGEVCSDRSNDKAVIVNRSFASTWFPGQEPLGHHLSPFNSFGKGSPPLPIIGIVADARESGIDRAPEPIVYWCGAEIDPTRHYLVRVAGEPSSYVEAIRRKLHSVEPGRAAYDFSPLDTSLGDAFAEMRLRTVLLAVFSATALSLAAVGLYGTLTYFVNVRKREVGLRLALGAERSEILVLFLRRALGITALGCAAGLCLATISSGALQGMLYGVAARDGASFAGTVLLMLLVAGVAALIPALRAARFDPMRVLRND